jgi:hypothetical protein
MKKIFFFRSLACIFVIWQVFGIRSFALKQAQWLPIDLEEVLLSLRGATGEAPQPEQERGPASEEVRVPLQVDESEQAGATKGSSRYGRKISLEGTSETRTGEPEKEMREKSDGSLETTKTKTNSSVNEGLSKNLTPATTSATTLTQLRLAAAASSPQGSQNQVPSKNPPLLDTKSSAFKAQVSSSVEWNKWCEKNIKPGYDLAPLADKHGVKKWIQTVAPYLKIAREYAYVDHAENITTELLESLPESYMMKATHMSGGIVMVNGDKVTCLRTPCRKQLVQENESNLAYMQRMCGLFLKNGYGERKREMWYSQIKRRCIFEEMLPLALGQGFQDFKIHMYHNRPMFIQINSDRFKSPTRNSLTPDWQELPWKADFRRANVGERPAFLDNMLSDATTLFKAANEMAKVDHVRVDFFAFNNAYYFSEMSMAHGSCGLYFKEPMANKFYGFVASHPEILIPPNAILDIYEAPRPKSNVT